MRLQKSLFLSHPCQLDHGHSTHPENAYRLEAIINELNKSSYKHLVDLSIQRLATKDELSQVHDLFYINYILSQKGKDAILDCETIITPGSVQAALSAAGLGIELVEQVLEKKIQNGFALIRPPGHHARKANGMGFCLFNNIAIAAQKAISMGIKRILILDWDVHHGNGTQEIFYEDDRVLFIDLHQENLFPSGSGLLNETGESKGLGYTVNIPLPPACKDADYLYIFDTVVRPLALKYEPELILVSCGFDAHESDPMGFMCLTTEGYGKLTAKVKKLAEEVCEGKIVFFLEGGYNPSYLAKNVMECIKVLVNETVSHPEIHPPSDIVKCQVRKIYDLHSK